MNLVATLEDYVKTCHICVAYGSLMAYKLRYLARAREEKDSNDWSRREEMG